MTPEEFFAGRPLAMAAYRRVCDLLSGIEGWTVRVSVSQVAFRGRRGFAYLWLPGRYLAHPTAEVVLSIALRRQIESGRFKEVVQPSPGHFMHHLEVHAAGDVDDEVASWLAEAAERAI